MSIVENSKLVHLVKDDDVVLNKFVDKLKWGVVKFISPEDNIQKKQLFDLNRFLYHNVNQQLVDMSNNIVTTVNNNFHSKIEQKINKLKSSKNKEDNEMVQMLNEIMSELSLDQEVESNKILRQYRLDQQDLTDRFINYQTDNRQALEKEFAKEVNSKTCIRGFKVSGAYENLSEAQERAKHVNNNIEPHINAYVVPLNVWVPWDPNPDAIQEQEFMLDELNDMMGKYKENVANRNEFFEKRKRMMIDQANLDNNKKLKEQLKQRINGSGGDT